MGSGYGCVDWGKAVRLVPKPPSHRRFSIHTSLEFLVANTSSDMARRQGSGTRTHRIHTLEYALQDTIEGKMHIFLA
eukprot:3583217-Pleurochrysis_carterae.AAC.3